MPAAADWELLFFQWYGSQKLPQPDLDVLFESGVVLAEIFEEAGQTDNVKQVLRKAIELSQQREAYWHCRCLFKLAVSDRVIRVDE